MSRRRAVPDQDTRIAGTSVAANAPSRGLLVLGMHRSGTSALSRMLQLAGANLGEQVTGGSRGNEAGHWEDAFALGVHERLLTAFGARWDTPHPLPADWLQSSAAGEARVEIARYLATTRSQHRCWSAKDPRMCLFGELWREAAIEADIPIAALVVVRHPLEVAASLRARDGMPLDAALLLWIEHTLGAMAIAERVPSRLVAYASLLRDWRSTASRIDAMLPGALDFASTAKRIDAYLDAGQRHHDLDAAQRPLPADLASAWGELMRIDENGVIDEGAADALRARLAATVPLLERNAGTARPRRQDAAGRARAPVALPGGRPALATASVDLPDVYFWAVIDWHFRYQRPQHLAQSLAKRGHRVFYVSNRFLSTEGPACEIEPLDGSGRLFQVRLGLAGAPEIYDGVHTPPRLLQLQRSLAELLEWTRTESAFSIVHHAYWTDLATMVPNARLVYDCLDHQPGFDENQPSVNRAEERLLGMADLVVASSAWIADEVGPISRSVTVVRNATEHAHFAARPSHVYQDVLGRRIIGYYGAIEAWFDAELVRAVAEANPDALVLLIGFDRIGASAALADLSNVMLTGEVAYADLPFWLYAFDVCILPFKVNALTLATNPVKVYEYLSAAKPVVAVDLPELAQFDGLIRTTTTQEAFVAAIADVLADPGSPGTLRRRRDFAAANTWEHRSRAFEAALTGIQEPKVSVVVLTHDNLGLTQACLDSIEAYSDYANLEVIVVDNASTDGSIAWLEGWATQDSPAGHVRHLVLNEDNAGFAAGNNAGLRKATGEVLVLLNNDTRATHGWVRGLCAHLRRDPRLGLIGPVTDNIGNEARIVLEGDTQEDRDRSALAYVRQRPGMEYPLATAAFFCVAMPRAVYASVGPLDEAYGLGFFEDDDYCRRVQELHYRIACAEDVFIHHHLSASFNRVDSADRERLFGRNRQLYESKWGPWVPHTYRDQGASS